MTTKKRKRFTIHGKRKNLSLGSYPSVSLADARKQAWTNATIINATTIGEGRDPVAVKRKESAARKRPPTRRSPQHRES